MILFVCKKINILNKALSSQLKEIISEKDIQNIMNISKVEKKKIYALADGDIS